MSKDCLSQPRQSGLITDSNRWVGTLQVINFFFFKCHHMSSQTSWSTPPPLGLWLKCNQHMKLGRPVGAVTLSRWEWWWDERWICGTGGGS